MEITPNYARIEIWRNQCNLSQRDLCSQVGISERTYRNLISNNSNTENHTKAVLDAIRAMAPILSPNNPGQFLRDIFGISDSIQTLIDNMHAALPYASDFVEKVTPLFLDTSNPIDCSLIIASFTGLLCQTGHRVLLSSKYTAGQFFAQFFTEMACELAVCKLELDPRTLEPIYGALIRNLLSLSGSGNGIASNEIVPVLDMLRCARIQNDSAERLKAIRAAFYVLYDNFYNIRTANAMSSLCSALSNISVLCTDYICTAPNTFILGSAIYNYCIALSSLPKEVGNA